ncbi:MULTISPECIES: sulfite exporter TauE/SafE family protein [unclassified Pseudonocardia]|uniref:sulfite exporter TauE/SafE family protein n=1 Tax=unclassified Pseudonocardia TaxID=2619320 RepID=UPI0014820E62|nr:MULTISPECIES: sulfite exporter TauE/SafE family protein [unclassified Pseudonocardia]
MLSTPLLLLSGLDLASVVVVNLVATLASRVVLVVRDRARIDRTRTVLLGLGVVPGAWAGAVVVGALDAELLRVGAGVLVVVLGVALLVTHRLGAAYRPGRWVQLATGLAGGFLSTSTSLNGPPVAILLQQLHLPPPRFIADLAAYFVVANSVSLLILGVQRRIPVELLWPTLPVLIVAAIAGNQVGRRLTDVIPAAAFRTVTIVVVIVSGLVTAIS